MRLRYDEFLSYTFSRFWIHIPNCFFKNQNSCYDGACYNEHPLYCSSSSSSCDVGYCVESGPRVRFVSGYRRFFCIQTNVDARIVCPLMSSTALNKHYHDGQHPALDRLDYC